MNYKIIILEITSVLLASFITYNYLNPFFLTNVIKIDRRYKIVFCIILVYTFLVSLIIPVHSRAIVSVALVLLIFCVNIFKYEKINKSFFSALILLLVFLVSDFLASFAVGIKFEDIGEFDSDIVLLFQYTFISRILAAITVKFISVVKNKSRFGASRRLLVGMVLAFVFSVLSVHGISEMIRHADTVRNHIYIVLSIAVFVLANLYELYLFHTELNAERTRVRADFLEKLIAGEKEYYETIAADQISVRKTAHDMKNTLMAILGALEENKTDIAEEKLREMLNFVDQRKQQVFTGRVVIDTILNDKFTDMKKRKIEFNPICLMSGTHNFDEISFCILLGNALDNAIEACEKLKEDNRFINFKITESEESLLCNIVNPTDGKSFGPGSYTSKADNKNHGFGIANMQTVIEKNGGNLTFKIDDNQFCVAILFQYDT